MAGSWAVTSSRSAVSSGVDASSRSAPAVRGVYIGEIAGLAGHFLIGSFWRLDVVFCLVMLLDWAVQFMKIRTSTNLRRLVSGLLCGYGMMDLELLLAESVICQAVLFLARLCDMGG